MDFPGALRDNGHVEVADRNPGRHRPSRIWQVLLAAVLVATASILAVALVLRSGITDGPLADGLEGPSLPSAGGDALPGQFFDSTIFSSQLSGDEDAVLDSIAPVLPPPHELTLRYALRVTGTPGGYRGWPPRGKTVPVPGAHVSPGEYAIIWIGAASPVEGTFSVADFRLSYHIGSRQYQTVIHDGLQVHVTPGCAVCAESPTDQL